LEDYGQNWKVKTRPYEGVSSMLDALTERGVKKAILSNKRHAFTRLCVKELLGRWKFEVVLGERQGVPRKPDPAGAIEAADFLKIPPSDFCYLGDTAVDMKTALGAGMFPIGVLWGFHPMEELKDSGARALLKRPLDILKLLDE
jgi:phosphoglycolate phosphatase